MNIVNYLKDIYLFKALSDEDLKTLSGFCTLKNYAKGEIVFYEKEIPKELVLLTEGRIKIYKTDLKNNEIILNDFKAVTLVAEMTVLENFPYPATASCLVDSTVLKINFEKFKDKFLYNPEMAFNMFKSLSKKIKHLDRVIALNIVLDSTARVAKFICDNEKSLQMKNNELSHYLHMTPETLSRTFKKLVTLGLIEKTSEGFVIKHREGLEVLFE